MFVRRKTVNGITYFYLVESYRDESGKVRQRMIEYLGDYDCAVAATENQPQLREKLIRSVTTPGERPRTLLSEADKLNQGIVRMQDEIDRLKEELNQLKSFKESQDEINRLKIPEAKKYAIEALKQFCEIEDAKSFCGGKKTTESAWAILNSRNPSSRWTKLARFYQWLIQED